MQLTFVHTALSVTALAAIDGSEEVANEAANSAAAKQEGSEGGGNEALRRLLIVAFAPALARWFLVTVAVAIIHEPKPWI